MQSEDVIDADVLAHLIADELRADGVPVVQEGERQYGTQVAMAIQLTPDYVPGLAFGAVEPWPGATAATFKAKFLEFARSRHTARTAAQHGLTSWWGKPEETP